MRISLRALVATTCILAAGTLCHAEQIDNPQYQNWSKFKPGTNVTMKTESDMGGSKTDMETTTTLSESTADKAVVESKMSMNIGGTKTDMPAQKMDVPAKIEKAAPPAADAPKPDVKESTEEIEVAGKKFKCKVTETKSSANGMTTVSKVWTCDDIPGGMAKMESTMDGAMKGTTKMTLTAMEIK